MRAILSLAMLVLMMKAAQAQDSSKAARPLTVSGYVEAYCSYDFNRPASNRRPDFLYNFNRHNEVNLNLGFVKLAYAQERVRGNLALAAGTYMNANYTAEPATLRNVFEANVGYRLSATKAWWLDLGILPSHIGFESAVGRDNWTLTRSLVAENSPYFESGARLSYATADGRFSAAALLLNGWQRITRVEGNSLASYGTQLTYKPTEKATLNYSTFLGTDKPDSLRRWRHYHNLYGIFSLSNRWALTTGFDIGAEQKRRGGRGYNTWYTPVAILRYTPSAAWAMALRGEYFSDPTGVIIATGTRHGFRTTGVSFNLDYRPEAAVTLRLEGRTFSSRDAIFANRAQLQKGSTAITFSMAVSL